MVPVHTLGFDTANERTLHHYRHRAEFPECASETEYEDAADEFLGGIIGTGVVECTTSRGRRLRFCQATNRLGSVSADNRIVTFLRPDPAVHRFRTNLDYFRFCCRR